MPLKITVATLAAAAFALPAHAKETSWNVADGYWNTSSNWNAGTPAHGDTAYISNDGTVRINNTIGINAYFVYIGNALGESGNVVVENGGTLNIGTATFRIGQGGYGELTVEEGGKVTSGNTLYFGHAAGGSAKVTVNGLRTAYNNESLTTSADFDWYMTSGALHVGNAGQAEFILNDAYAQLPNYLYIGTEATGNGTVTMNGNSYATIRQLKVGSNGTGTFNLNGNSIVTVGNGTRLGDASGSSGTLVLSDSAAFTNTSTFYVGYSGKGDLTIQDNASLTTTSIRISNGSAGDGVITVKGNGILNTNSVNVEGTGTGQSGITVDGSGKIIATSTLSLYAASTMDILDKGYVSNTNGTIAYGSAVKVSGSEATWANSGYVYVGNYGTGNSLLIENGGKVTNTAGYIGVFAGSEASVTVSGASSRWDNSSSIIVSYLGKGTLIIEDGTVTNTSAAIAYSSGTTGSVEISGGGSWQNSSDLSVGEYGSGVLTLSDTASVSAAQIALGNQAGSTGTLNIMGAGVKITGTDSSSLLNIASGAGTGKVVFGHSGNMQFSNLMSGTNLSVTHSGLGTTTLNAANTYAGGTVISGGIVVAGNSSALGIGNLSISGGSLKSTVNSVSVANLSMSSGSIAFADGVARTVNVLDFEMTGGSLEIDILGLETFDTIVSSSGLLTLSDGKLVLSGYEGFEGTGDSGNRYHIFNGFEQLSDYGIQITNYDMANWVAAIDEEGYLYFTAQVPEPAAVAALMGLGGLGFALWRRKRR